MKTLHYGITVSSESPITGVVDTTAPEWLLEEIDLHGIDLDFEEHCKECTREYHDDCYETDPSTNYLLGYKKNLKGDFVPDLDAEFSAIMNGNENTTQVTRSNWVSRVMLCSPCYPGQGDLGNSGDYLAYTLPPGVWGNHNHIQINELSVTLGSIRELYDAFYNTDLNTLDFAADFFYMIGELLNGKKLNELNPAGSAAGTLKLMLENKGMTAKENMKSVRA
ncbi:MAG: hypothetical protein J5U17_06025 [Candidatus Methanoperedens sp.]|nr:hypothetical protein [Candidatus Methanoperedens sp.]MCE8428594.1 hypothetical protein [Candidatus Methanoperedens sp.]